jgi:hypothetical protein
MKAENKKKAASLLGMLLPKFTGLSEKSACKMTKIIEQCTIHMAKKFNNLQEDDTNYGQKMEQKADKKIAKATKVLAKAAERVSDKASETSKSAMIAAYIQPKATIRKARQPNVKTVTTPKTTNQKTTTSKALHTSVVDLIAS